MGIPLNPASLIEAIDTRPSPMMSALQIANGLRNIKVHANSPQMVYGMQVNPFTNQSVVYNKLTGAKEGEAGFHYNPSIQKDISNLQHINRNRYQLGMVSDSNVSSSQVQPSSLSLGSSNNMPQDGNNLGERLNILTHDPYHPGGSQIINQVPGGLLTRTSPTQSAQTRQQVGQSGEAAFESMYPFMSKVINKFGYSGYGSNVKGMMHILSSNPKDEDNLNNIAMLLALNRMKPTISADLGRMATGGTPGERTMASYGSSLMKPLPSDLAIRSALILRPDLSKKIVQRENDYYFQLEREAQEAKNKSIAGGSPVYLKNATIGSVGQPEGPVMRNKFNYPIGNFNSSIPSNKNGVMNGKSIILTPNGKRKIIDNSMLKDAIAQGARISG